ncbi:hypothetical protein BDN70DRAFT_231585 [Pholiota conissans]|uniref:Uncharacterized protein n=1 Tax=Pholiota conissans TaxID=109636 RepID=A0A9P5YUY2_9AGAR|nr:hypothetical protein BDN70DRAFT_231585 [Pholiota conissans]
MFLHARCTNALLVLACLVSSVCASYFVITEPQAKTEWVNGSPHLVQWTKGLLDDINGFDVEMTRLSKDGLTLVAMNVPASQGKLNILLQDVPAGDDYFLVFINSTHGVMHATSPRFAVLDASATPSSPPDLTAAPGIPTVTVSGSPNPTQLFATTFPAIASNAGRLGWGVGREGVLGWTAVVGGLVMGAVCAVW